jgi:F0F1-type ATP synthase assembly protein I
MENNEENKINEAEILEPERVLEEPKEDSKKKKYDLYVEFVLLFILGVLLGIALKNEATRRVTIGFDDYKMNIMKSDFDINQIEKDILEAQKKEQEQEQEQEKDSNNQTNGEVK